MKQSHFLQQEEAKLMVKTSVQIVKCVCSNNLGIKSTSRLLWSDGGAIMAGLHVALMTDCEHRGLSQAAN